MELFKGYVIIRINGLSLERLLNLHWQTAYIYGMLIE